MNPSPIPDPRAHEPLVNPPVAQAANMAIRLAILCLLLAALLNVVREITYYIGFLQVTNGRWLAPQQLRLLMSSLPICIVAGVLCVGLKNRDAWARRAAIICSLLGSMKVGWELYWLLVWRAQGNDKGDVQICVLMIMLTCLLIAVLYLMTKNGREPFREQTMSH